MRHSWAGLDSILPQWLRQALPKPLEPLAHVLLAPWVLSLLAGLSLTLFVLSLLGVPWLVRRIPVDYLLDHGVRPKAHGLHLLGRILRNSLGAVLLALGVLMLVLPGQGLLTIVVGLMLIDFPGKTALKRKLIGHHRVLSAINRIRQRSGHPALHAPGHTETE